MNQPSPQSVLLQELRNAIAASRLSDDQIEELTLGAVSYVTIWRWRTRTPDNIKRDLSKIQRLAQVLSTVPACLRYWQQHAHPTHEACVLHWTRLYWQAFPNARSRARKRASLSTDSPLPSPHVLCES